MNVTFLTIILFSAIASLAVSTNVEYELVGTNELSREKRSLKVEAYWRQVLRGVSNINLFPAGDGLEEEDLQLNEINFHQDYYDVHIIWDEKRAMPYKEDISKFNSSNEILMEELRGANKPYGKRVRFGSALERWEFPFYGHKLDGVVLTTSGFVYLGTPNHRNLAQASQYVAPLMAYFNAKDKNAMPMRVFTDDEKMFIRWMDVIPYDYYHNNVSFEKKRQINDTFGFDLTMYRNGTIKFYYEKLPVDLQNLTRNFHPVALGIADASVIKHSPFNRTVLEYHKIDLLGPMYNKQIKNGTAIIFQPRQTCVSFQSCLECVGKIGAIEKHCLWCEVEGRCTDGVDRHMMSRSNLKHCSNNLTDLGKCDAVRRHDRKMNDVLNELNNHHSTVSVFVVFAILVLVGGVIGLGVWIFHAYRNPQTRAGQFLIRYSPRNIRHTLNARSDDQHISI